MRTALQFENLLTIARRDDLRVALASSRLALSLPQVQRLAAHAESLEPAAGSLRLGVIHTYTSDLLDPWLHLAGALQGLKLHTYHAPYGLSLQEAQEDSALVRHAPDVTLLLLQREDLHPQLAGPIGGLSAAAREKLRDEVVEQLCGIVNRFRVHKVGQILVTLLPSRFPP